MKCPHCKDKDLVMSERKGVEIDYCPECRGIWLDKGELDKILERSQKEEMSSANPPQDFYSNPSHGGNYSHKPYKKRKSFFEELFD
ncbi:zf-TFIIB domain-containing protein [Bdellovibrio sp. KM01]|uniref:TFIIB-type zinc ribbon-containing protein n=1 Tax=Bdellovibrio sp. KM01 TaxID=2748865 RepID=UPI0015EAF166|nr:zf-TFIIB domain-containing protein [Bdellovibrio sp. KM01]QLY26673.1 zf-TFIIB domain-containing protein [Bdellovibrio sp. KM01]